MLNRLWQKLQTVFQAPWRRAEVMALYNTAAQHARRPEFFSEAGVPDVMDGRFDLLILHIALLMIRLQGDAEELKTMRQHLFDFLGENMEHNLRQMGVGDMGLPHRIKAMGEAFYGRLAAYSKALELQGDAGQTALADVLRRNLYSAAQKIAPEALQVMVKYTRRAHEDLSRQPTGDLLAGQVVFPGLKAGQES